jgi:hypothetical protein
MRWVLSRVFSAAFWLFVSGIGYTGVTYGEGANTNGMKTIEGSVWYRERMALPPNAEIRIALENVARMDAPSEVIATARAEQHDSRRRAQQGHARGEFDLRDTGAARCVIPGVVRGRIGNRPHTETCAVANGYGGLCPQCCRPV